MKPIILFIILANFFCLTMEDCSNCGDCEESDCDYCFDYHEIGSSWEYYKCNCTYTCRACSTKEYYLPSIESSSCEGKKLYFIY